MRFLHSIPLPLLLILNSLVSFESQIIPPVESDKQEPTLDDNSSPNDGEFNNLTYVFDNYDKLAEQYRRKNNADVIKPLPLESEITSEPTITDNYNELSVDELSTKLESEEANARKLNEAIAAENAKLEQKVKEAEEPFKKYKEAKIEWERLDRIYNEKNKERLGLVYKAGNATKHWKEAEEAYEKIEEIVTGQVEREDEIEKLNLEILDLKNNDALLAAEKTKETELKTNIRNQKNSVRDLLGAITTAEGPFDTAQRSFDSHQLEYNTKQCDNSGHKDCPDIIKSVNSANTTLQTKKDILEGAKEKHRLANEQLVKMGNELTGISEKVKKFKSIEMNPQSWIDVAETKLTRLKDEQSKEEQPLDVTRELNKTAAAKFAQATDSKIEADRKLAEYPEENIRTEKEAAGLAWSIFSRKENIRNPLHDELERMKKHLQELEKQRDQSNARVGALKRTYDAKTAQNPSTGGIPIWLWPVLGVLILAVIVVIAVVLIMKRKRKGHNGEKPVATESQVSLVPPQDSVPNTASSASQVPQSTPGTPAGESISNPQQPTAPAAGSGSNANLAITPVAGSDSNPNLATVKSREPADDDETPQECPQFGRYLYMLPEKLSESTELEKEIKKYVEKSIKQGRKVRKYYQNDCLKFTNQSNVYVRLWPNVGIKTDNKKALFFVSACQRVHEMKFHQSMTAAVNNRPDFEKLIHSLKGVRKFDESTNQIIKVDLGGRMTKVQNQEQVKFGKDLAVIVGARRTAEKEEEDKEQMRQERIAGAKKRSEAGRSPVDNDDADDKKQTTVTVAKKDGKKPVREKSEDDEDDKDKSSSKSSTTSKRNAVAHPEKKRSRKRSSGQQSKEKGKKKHRRNSSSSRSFKHEHEIGSQTNVIRRFKIPKSYSKAAQAEIAKLVKKYFPNNMQFGPHISDTPEIMQKRREEFAKGKELMPSEEKVGEIIEHLNECIKHSKQASLCLPCDIVNVLTPALIHGILYKVSSEHFEPGDRLIEYDPGWAPNTIVGDLHGQSDDLSRIFEYDDGIGSEQFKKQRYLFLGDYVDRGKYSLEVFMLLVCLKIQNPKHFTLLRGNHESYEINVVYGFYFELRKRLGVEEGTRYLDHFGCCFATMPLAARAGTFFFSHGGIPIQELKDLHEINNIEKFLFNSKDNPIAMDLTWEDQRLDIEGPRGCSELIGPGWVAAFGTKHGIDTIVRAHQKHMNGYDFHSVAMDQITIFSASDYENSGNAGCMMKIVNDKLLPLILFHPGKEDERATKALIDQNQTGTLHLPLTGKPKSREDDSMTTDGRASKSLGHQAPRSN